MAAQWVWCNASIHTMQELMPDFASSNHPKHFSWDTKVQVEQEDDFSLNGVILLAPTSPTNVI